jgi:hypothetical protein
MLFEAKTLAYQFDTIRHFFTAFSFYFETPEQHNDFIFSRTF